MAGTERLSGSTPSGFLGLGTPYFSVRTTGITRKPPPSQSSVPTPQEIFHLHGTRALHGDAAPILGGARGGCGSRRAQKVPGGGGGGESPTPQAGSSAGLLPQRAPGQRINGGHGGDPSFPARAAAEERSQRLRPRCP